MDIINAVLDYSIHAVLHACCCEIKGYLPEVVFPYIVITDNEIFSLNNVFRYIFVSCEQRIPH